MPRSLWRCPECRRTFANRNQSHTCGPANDINRHFVRRDPSTRALFDAIAELVRAQGPVSVLAEKTRIAFHVRISCIGVVTRKDHLIVGFLLGRRIEHPRFEKIETFSPRNHVHRLRVHNLGDLDDDFRAWVAEAYAVGEQKHLHTS